MAGEYLSSPSRSSGGRYHSVITLLVYGRLEAEKQRRRWDWAFTEQLLAPVPEHELMDSDRHLVVGSSNSLCNNYRYMHLNSTTTQVQANDISTYSILYETAVGRLLLQIHTNISAMSQL